MLRRCHTWIVPALVACVVLYAALLRLDVLFKAYGPYDAPRWLAASQPLVRAAAAAVTPDWNWKRDPDPYGGGDPVNYLKFAREMGGFYAAHAREPMFPALTRAALWMTGGRDVAVSLASIAASLAAITATYLLGASAGSPVAGLAAAAMMAIDRNGVWWSIGGWRDELFAGFAIASAWAWLRVWQRPSPLAALVAGIVSGGALLTRITSVTLMIPAIVWIVAAGTRESRRHAAAAAAIALALVAPFLVNCAIATGDPLYAINNHTDFYLNREGAVDAPRPSALGYVLGKFEDRPLAALDNAVVGVFVYPFTNKWIGLDEWVPGLGVALGGLAAAGLASWLLRPEGRFLLALLAGALVPFSMTWTVRGGAEWRLTYFAYGFYLVAGFDLAARLAQGVVARWRSGTWSAGFPVDRQYALRAVSVYLLLLVVGALWAFAVPYATVREALANGEPAMIVAGPRDRWFFSDGWETPEVAGNVTTRSAVDGDASLSVFLPDARNYDVILRLDPEREGEAIGTNVSMAVNGRTVDEWRVTHNRDRIGEYRTSIPAAMVTPGVQHIELRADADFKLWYMRIAPQ